MPILNSRLIKSDPFVMNEDTVNKSIADFLETKGFTNVNYLSGNKTGIDVSGRKNGWRINVESKGSHANHHDNNLVFDSNQIKTHTYMQICKLMEYNNRGDEKTILALANPDIPRIRERVQKIMKSTDRLGFIRIWVQQDRTIKFECRDDQVDTLRSLSLLD